MAALGWDDAGGDWEHWDSHHNPKGGLRIYTCIWLFTLRHNENKKGEK